MATGCCRILLQKEMREARRAIGFCYLCGEDLPPKDEPGRRQILTKEHIIPRQLLGDPPKAGVDGWSVVLDVHRACEQSMKQAADHWLKLLQEIHVRPLDEWSDPGHLRWMGISPSFLWDPRIGRFVPTFAGLGELLEGVWSWIRGLHAALYREFLSDHVGHFSFPPVPACSPGKGGPTIEETEQQSAFIRDCIALAESLDKWDGVTAWGGALRYRCVWWQSVARVRTPNWICYWTLAFPRLEDWSRQVLPRGFERPWQGHYRCAAAPSNAAVLTSEDFPAETDE